MPPAGTQRRAPWAPARAPWAFTLVLLAASLAAPAQEIIKVGAGGYTLTRPASEKPPSDKDGNPVKPKVTSRFAKPVTSNKWWSSLIWPHDPANPWSGNLYAHPLVLRAQAEGLGLAYPTKPDIQPRSYFFPYAQDILVGVAGLRAPDTRVDDYSDWTVTAAWDDGSHGLKATFGHGLPFAYFTRRGGNISVTWPEGAAASVWSGKGAVAGLNVNGHAYGLFAPAGSAWTKAPHGLASTLNGKDYFSVAVLPDSAAETLELFRKHAFAFVTDSRVAWECLPSGRVKTTFTLKTDLKEKGVGLSAAPLMALYRHQWLNTQAPLTRHTYVSPRGTMKLLEGASFSIELPFDGVLPILPLAAAAPGAAPGSDFKPGKLKTYVKEAWKGGDLFPKGLEGTRDTYWEGKSLLRNLTLARIADQIGYPEARDDLLKAIKQELEMWLAGGNPSHYWYDSTWRSLIGTPTVYRSGWEMNDHHFHNAYYLIAAATVAQYDPAWAATSRWGGMLNLLARDAANWDRVDARFPFLRYFDPYAGHSWANGPGSFPEGNNEESSSEDLLFSTALILWGAATGQDSLRDLGIFFHASEAAAADQYWFDADSAVFPKGFGHPLAAINWGAGVKYDTWWSQNPVYVHGINYLPLTGGSLYLARRPERLVKAFDLLEKENRGPVRLWRDVHWMALALGDPARALEQWNKNPHYEPEWGLTRAATYHWLSNLAALGRVDTSVHCAWPLHAVFAKDGRKTYVGYNPTQKPITLKFSDGKSGEIAAGSLSQF